MTLRSALATNRWRVWLLPALLFIVSLPAVTTRLYASDEIQYFAYLRSVWFDGDLSFDNEYRYFYDRNIARAWGFRETFLERQTETGLRINFAPVGSALLWTPFYAVADLTVVAMRAGGSSVPRDGFSQPYIAAVTYGSAVYGFLAVLLSAVAARRVVGAGALAAGAVWIGTPLVFYMYVTPGMSHACSAFTVALFLYAWLRVRTRWSTSGLAVLGALTALMTMVREQDALFAIGPGLDYLSMFGGVRGGAQSQDPTRLLRNGLAAVAAFAVVYLPQAVAYVVLNGRMGPSNLVSRKMSWSAPHALEVLVSPEHGFLWWTPLAVLCVIGLVMSLTNGTARAESRDARWIGVLALVMVVAQVYVAGSVESWSAAGTFGHRRFVALTAPLTIGLATLVLRVGPGWRRGLLGAAVALTIWWNVGLMAQFGMGTMSRQRLDLLSNAHQTFVRLPFELPRLAYRYVTDRESFYERQ